MDLKTAHERLSFYANKSSLFFSPEEYDAALDIAQLNRFNELKPSYAATQQVQDALMPFIGEQPFTVQNGRLTLPEDYHHLTAIEITVQDGGRTIYPIVELISADEISYRRSSQLIPLTIKNPIGEYKPKKQVQVYPVQAISGVIKYLTRPAKPVFAYTISNGAISYDELLSTQMEWNDTEMEQIIKGALVVLGLNVKDGDLVGYANTKQ